MAEFSNTICMLSEGQVETDLSLALKSLVAAVRDTGKPGKIALTLEVGKDKHDPRAIRISTDIKLKLPEIPLRPTYFIYRNGRLINVDDTQQKIDFGQGVKEPLLIDIDPVDNQGANDK